MTPPRYPVSREELARRTAILDREDRDRKVKAWLERLLAGKSQVDRINWQTFWSWVALFVVGGLFWFAVIYSIVLKVQGY